MTLIVDASVVLKWVIQEDGSDQARSLISADTLAAPDLLFIECANVLWVKARRGVLSIDNAKMALAAIEATPVRIIPVHQHVAAAQSIAFDLDQTAYDCLYLAAALSERAILVSADAAFVKAASAHPVYRNSVRLL